MANTDNRDIQSPVTGNTNISVISKVKIKSILRLYENHFGVNVSKYFVGLDEIKRLRCNDTGYVFYYPFSVAGDSNFYEDIWK